MNRFPKKITAILILFTFFSSLPFSAQTKGKTAQTPTELLASETNSTMSSAWKNGVLPKPLPLPAGNTDEVTAILAQKIAAKNEESIPALLTALQLSGFFITDKEGKVFLAPPDGKGQGLTINGWEVASAAKMFGDGRATNLAELGEKLQSIPELKQADVDDFLLEGVRRNADNNRNAFLRIWARFIVELGKNSASKYNILSGASAEHVSLDAIQHLLLMRRLYGDAFALSQKYKPQTTGADFRRESEPHFIKAGFSANKFSAFQGGENHFRANEFVSNKMLPADEKQIPCRMDGNAPTVMDASATILGVGFGEFTGYLEDAFEGTPTGDNIKKFTKITGIMNILLAYAKFIQTYASLESKIVLEGSPPLVRTKNAVAGERKNLRTEVRVNIGNWQMYNCIRTAMNVTTGIDFATINDGPLSDVGIRWHLDEGGGKDVYSNTGGITGKEQIVGFAQTGSTRIQDQGTSAGTGNNAVKDVTYTKTDDKGIARIILEGSPQKNFKGANAVAVTKQAKIRTTIKMKAGEIKGDMVDVAGQAIAGIPGLITMPVELLYRMDWASVASLTVPVRDWEDCEGKGWNGTIEVSYRKTESWTKVTNKGEHMSDQHHSGTEQYKWYYNYDAIFNVKDSPGEAYEDGGYSATLKGKITAEALRVSKHKHSWTTKLNCFPDPTRIAGSNALTIIKESGKIDETIDDGTLRINGGEFKISFLISEIGGTNVNTTNIKPFGFCMPEMNPPTDTTHESSMSFSVEGITIEGTLDPNNPNQIEGSKSYTDDLGNEVVIRWSLRNCR